MEHGARLSTSRVMAIAFIFMSVLIVLSLSVNVIQGVNNYRLQNEQRTAVSRRCARQTGQHCSSQNQSRKKKRIITGKVM